jgi:hypothetical protein
MLGGHFSPPFRIIKFHTGKNQPITKLTRFMPRLSKVASRKRSRLEGIQYRETLSIIQIRISAISRVMRYREKKRFNTIHKKDCVMKFAQILVIRMGKTGFPCQREYPVATTASAMIVMRKVRINSFWRGASGKQPARQPDLCPPMRRGTQ